MTALTETLASLFEKSYSDSPEWWIRAPGRVNLIGEHTDYNEGFVLPCAIDYETVIAAKPRPDQQIRVVSADYPGEQDEFDLQAPIEFQPDRLWVNYIRGVVQSFQKAGLTLGGMDLAIQGNIPQGAGLSSSASLEVAVGQTLKELFDLPLTQTDLALHGQQAENHFVGCNSGIMDQLISAKGQQHHALLIDCRSLETRAVPMPEDFVVVIINSNKKRGLVDSFYNQRREQCTQAAEVLEVPALRDATQELFEQKQHLLEPVMARRARHVITENARTLEAAKALAQGDLKRLGELMMDSHASMRDDFEITVPEIDLLVSLVKEVIGPQGGVRMTGGGFGGCIVAVVPPDAVEPVRAAVAEQYEAQTGLKESFYVCHASEGAGRVA